MVEISAFLVKTLREKTGAPMMECKNALVESNGDLIQAEKFLRIKLGKKISRSSTKLTSEGIVNLVISSDFKKGAIVEVNCETDFVAKNNEFIEFVEKLTILINTKRPVNLSELSQLNYDRFSVNDVRTKLIGKFGENISIRRFELLNAKNFLNGYIHNGKIGVLVDLDGNKELAKDLSMHIAAYKPKFLDSDSVSNNYIDFERSVAKQKAINSIKNTDKYNDKIDKIIDGSIQKFLKEVTLMPQPFIKNDQKTVKQVLQDNCASLNNFILYILGENLEKKEY